MSFRQARYGVLYHGFDPPRLVINTSFGRPLRGFRTSAMVEVHTMVGVQKPRMWSCQPKLAEATKWPTNVAEVGAV